MGILKSSGFGKTKNDQQVKLVTMENSNKMQMSLTDYGATLVSVKVPGENGLTDVVLGYDDVTGYIKNDGYIGATIGRNGNRIGGATVTIGQKEYQLEKNEKGNNLHSGPAGFDTVIWKMEICEEQNSVIFTYHSPDLDQGLPGNVDVSVTYTLTEENEIKITYEGKTDADTILNMTNHSYFNLDGHDSGEILEQKLWIDADAYTAVDSQSIPTGENPCLKNTPMDFSNEKTIGRDIEADFEQLKLTAGYDHNYVLNHQNEGIRKIAKATAAKTGIVLEVYTDLPGVQFYSGNYVTKEHVGKGGHAYGRRSGFCLETQVYPDAIHHKDFPTCMIKAGEIYNTTTIYKFLRR